MEEETPTPGPAAAPSVQPHLPAPSVSGTVDRSSVCVSTLALCWTPMPSPYFFTAASFRTTQDWPLTPLVVPSELCSLTQQRPGWGPSTEHPQYWCSPCFCLRMSWHCIKIVHWCVFKFCKVGSRFPLFSAPIPTISQIFTSQFKLRRQFEILAFLHTGDSLRVSCFWDSLWLGLVESKLLVIHLNQSNSPWLYIYWSTYYVPNIMNNYIIILRGSTVFKEMETLIIFWKLKITSFTTQRHF